MLRPAFLKATAMFQRHSNVSDSQLPLARPFSTRYRDEGPLGQLIHTLDPGSEPATQQLLTNLAREWSAVAPDATDAAIVEGLQRRGRFGDFRG